MKEIDLFGRDIKSISPLVSSMSHTNCHFIADPSMEKGRILVGFPGSEVIATASGPSRGLHASSNNKGLYSVVGNKVIRINRGGVITQIGDIETERGFVSMDDSGIQLMIVDGVNGYIVELTPPEGEEQTVTKIDAEFFPKNPSSVIFNTGRFLVNELGTGKFYGSDIYDGFKWEGLNFATAETSPDNLMALVNGNFGVFYLMGNATIETWYNDGGPNFPYSMMTGGLSQIGLVNQRSVVRFGNRVVFLGISHSEEQNFYVIEGNSVKSITNAQMAYVLRNLRLPSVNVACGYSANGTSIYQITFGENGETYYYDFKFNLWGRRVTRGRSGHVFEFGAFTLGDQIFTSRFDGKIYKTNNLLLKDGDEFQDLEWVGRHLSKDEDRFSVNELQIKMEVGYGKTTDYNESPKVMLSYSKDSHSWTPEVQGSLGRIGEYLIRVIWRRLGLARDILFKIRITDLVERKIISAFMSLR